MPIVATAQRAAARMVALVAATLALGLAAAPIAPAAAATAKTLAPTTGTDDEGGTPSLRGQLEAASKGYIDAKAALEKSVKRQGELNAQLKTIEVELTARTATVGEIADVAYRTGRAGMASALLASGSPDSFMNRAAALDAVAANQDRHLRQLQETKSRHTQAQAALNKEIREQRKQLAVMAKRKQQAERALAVASRPSTTVRSTTTIATAKPAPRNADGSWPPETCSVDDPTTSGCITPRTLHALNQAKAAGFTRYVSCYRDGSSGEHPKGRACDFSAQAGSFGGDATGGDKTYGDNLAAYFVRNADRLAVLYVIWYRQIWLPSSGWKSYSGAGGDPSSDHTNHVHLSIY